jgi:hypothetical protein
VKENSIRRAVREGRAALGTGLKEFASRGVPHIIQSSGFDYCMIDMEHGAFDLETIADLAGWRKKRAPSFAKRSTRPSATAECPGWVPTPATRVTATATKPNTRPGHRRLPAHADRWLRCVEAERAHALIAPSDHFSLEEWG